MVAGQGTDYMNRTLTNYGEHAVRTFEKRIRQQRRFDNEKMLSYLSSRVETTGISGKLIFTLNIRQRFLDMNSKSKVYNRPVLWYFYKLSEHLSHLAGMEASEILNNNLKD